MYSAIKLMSELIAEQAYKAWRKGDDTEPVIQELCKAHNMTDWVSTVRDSLTRIIQEQYFKSRT